MKKYFPFLEWMANYKKADFSGDLSAGLTVGVMLIPQGMAYAMLAGLPPIYGLYASTVPLIIYALFGTSRQLAVGPVAMAGLLISSGVGLLATQGSDEFISLTILLALMVGIIQLTMGVFRLGFLVNFLSHPVISGFTSAAAIIIAFSQLKYLLGMQIPRGKVHEIIQSVAQHWNQINAASLALGLGTIAILILSKKVNKRLPGPLLVVLLGVLIVYFFQLSVRGVSIVGDIPEGLPAFGVPAISRSSITALLPIAFVIAFIGFLESIAVAKALQARHKNYQVVPNQELIALGLANITGSFFKAFPAMGGFGRSAVNDQAGARTGLASIISASLIIITLLFLTSYFYYLPHAVLAAIIMVAVYGLIDIKEAKHLWRTDKKDFALFIITAAGTLVLGIEEGILIGVSLSLLMVIYKISYPHIAELGRVPDTNHFRNVNRFDGLIKAEDMLIIRMDAQLYFANVNFFRKYVEEQLALRPQLKYLIFDASAMSSIDSSALHMLHDLINELNRDNIQLHLVDVKGPIRDTLYKSGTHKILGADRFHMSIHEAVAYIRDNVRPTGQHYVNQTN